MSALTGRELDAAVAYFVVGGYGCGGWDSHIDKSFLKMRSFHKGGLDPRTSDVSPDKWTWPIPDRIDCPAFSTSRDACALAEAEIEKRGLALKYSQHLVKLVATRPTGVSAFRLATAPPEARCRALLAAIEEAERGQ